MRAISFPSDANREGAWRSPVRAATWARADAKASGSSTPTSSPPPIAPSRKSPMPLFDVVVKDMVDLPYIRERVAHCTISHWVPALVPHHYSAAADRTLTQ